MRGIKTAAVVALMVLGLSAVLLATEPSEEPNTGSTGAESTARLDTGLFEPEPQPEQPTR